MKPPVCPERLRHGDLLASGRSPDAKSGSPSAQALIKRVGPSPAVFDDGRTAYAARPAPLIQSANLGYAEIRGKKLP
jgi:hypothetical protein